MHVAKPSEPQPWQGAPALPELPAATHGAGPRSGDAGQTLAREQSPADTAREQPAQPGSPVREGTLPERHRAAKDPAF